MYTMLQNSLGPYLAINKTSPKNLQVIIDKNIVEDYVKRGVYLCLVAKINSEDLGLGSRKQVKAKSFLNMDVHL